MTTNTAASVRISSAVILEGFLISASASCNRGLMYPAAFGLPEEVRGQATFYSI
jgi:hypothetical protein